ncbi:zinc ABC transporter ATP-binding protein AztA [Agreia sp. PsM10]|uniref:zinc ABC transporter ATP-binding protein AztA n=1 Tax=Agreia sp. PsM10 TaxID=3030533 RepID=UPI00263A781E|nr:zinc ABC transporter ATP-binding protein AztA [Agreia sp. PsM10]MDN4640907.1 zinc ABC transporter ATP-binding protein AztA [Agreia sp. PsM10]
MQPPRDISSLAALEIEVRFDRTTALSGVSADFTAGTVTALSGGNGSGKSTLLGVLAGTITPQSGRVLGPTRRPALVVQRSAASDTLPLSVLEVVSMGRWAHRGMWRRLDAGDRETVQSCMRALGIQNLAERPLGSLSGGQRQRALVAQGLARRADVLLLDEPTAGVDADAQHCIVAALRAEARRGAIVVHATHEPSVLHEADAILRLERGRMVRPS